MVLEDWHFDFISEKDNFNCIEVSIQIEQSRSVKLKQYLGVFHLSGIPSSFLIILSSKIGQLDI